MNDLNPYAAPQTHDTRAVEYKPLPTVTVDPQTVRTFSYGALILWVFDSPLLFVIFGFSLGAGSFAGLALYELVMLVGFYLLTKNHAVRTGLICFWLAFVVHLLGTILLLVVCLLRLDRRMLQFDLLMLIFALHGVSIVLTTAGMYRLGRALGASAIRKTSLTVLCCAGAIALISPLLWLLTNIEILPRSLIDTLGLILGYSLWGGYITVLAMLYFAWQLPNEMRRRLQRNLPDEIQMPASFVETAALADLNQLELEDTPERKY